MYNYTLSQVAGVLTLAFMASSYFFKRKNMYLLLQAAGLFAMLFSYLFRAEFFPMISLGVSLARTVTFWCFEKKDKEAPIAFPFLFVFLTFAAYLGVNILILETASPLDTMYLVIQIMYIFVFRIRNIKLMRYLITVPIILSITYNLLLGDMQFVVMSYCFELLADIYNIIRYRRKGENTAK